MANHQQHTTFSSPSGLVFGTLAWYPCGFPAVTCLLAGGLCGVGGMLPDIDIKTSRSFHDCMSITACITSMLVILRVSTMGVSAEMISVIGAAVFIAIKFGVGSLIQAFTVHRGMIHSVPFAILCGEILFLTTAGDMSARFLKAAGLSLGFFTHLLLDEIYSVDVVKLNTKKSFGTALKFGMLKHVKLTVILYFLLFCATFISFRQPNMIGEALDHALDQIAELTIRGTQHLEEASLKAQQQLRSGTNYYRDATTNSQTNENALTTGSQLAQVTSEPPSREYPEPIMPTLQSFTIAMGNSYTSTSADMTADLPTRPSVSLPINPPGNSPGNLFANPQVTIPRPSLRDEISTSGYNPSVSPAGSSQLPLARPAF